MVEDVLEVWRVHEEINFFLLEQIPGEGFGAVTLLKNGKPSTGRTVSRVFAHLHGVRVTHIGREFLKGIPRFETGASPSREELLEAFRASGRGIEQRLARIVERRDHIKERHGVILLGYLIAHESHHRGQILLALKQCGIRMPEEARFGIWEHRSRRSRLFVGDHFCAPFPVTTPLALVSRLPRPCAPAPALAAKRYHIGVDFGHVR